MATTLDVLQISVKSQGVTENTRQLDNLGKAAESTEKKVVKLVESVDKMIAKFSTSVSGTKALTDALTVVNKQSLLSENAVKALTSSVDKLASKFSEMSAKMNAGNAVIKQSTVHIEHHTRSMNDAHAAARGLTGSLGALWLTYGNVAPLAAGAAIGASLKSILVIGADVENTLEAIRLKTGATAEEMQQLTRVISDMGKSIYGPQEVTKALETLSLAGLNATQAATAVGAALNLATSGGTTIEKSAEALVTIGTAVGATADQYDYLADAIQKTANVSLASVDSIAESVKRASVVNKLYGASFEDILTQTAALAQLGIKNSAAGTAITNFYANAMGSTEKAKKALDALGFSFQDATGKAKEIVPAFEEFVQKLNQFDLASQKKIISEIFGERALRDVEALRDLTLQTVNGVSGLARIRNEIQDSAGSAILIATEQAMTTENQFKSMSNTLKSVFADAFKEIQPQVDSIIRKLRELFDSPEFKTAITNLVKGFINLAEIIASNIKPLIAMGEAFLVISTITAGGTLFSKMVPAIQGLIGVVTMLATSLTSAGTAANIAAGGMTAISAAARLLPGVGIAIGIVTAAVALYSVHTEEAAKSTADLAEETRKAAAQYSGDFLKSLDDQIDRLTRVNEALRTGTSLQEANNKATAEGALAKQRGMFTDSETAAVKALAEEEEKLARIRKNVGFNYTQQSLVTDQVKKVSEAQEAVNRAKAVTAKFDKDALDKANKIVQLTKQQQEQIEINTRSTEVAALGRVDGTKTFNPKAEQEAKKALSFLEQERLDLMKVAAGYDARTTALLKSFDTGINLAAESREAIVEVNRAEGKYASEAAYNAQLALAREADKKKLILDNTKAYVEFGIKLNGIIEAEKNFNNEGNKTYGNLRRQAEAIIKLTGLDSDRAAALREQADAADLVNKAIDSRMKLERAIGSTQERADGIKEEADAMLKYGEASKISALAAAELLIVKLKLASVGDEAAKNNLREAASLLQLNTAYRNLAQQSISLDKEIEKAQADSVLMFAESEQQKIQIKANSLKKQSQMEFDRAKEALEKNKSLNGGVASKEALDSYEDAYRTFTDNISKIDALSSRQMTNVRLEDWKKTANQIADTVLEGFDNIFDKGISVWKSFTDSIKKMFQKTIIEYIKKEFAKPIVLNVVGSVAGSFGMTGLANAANSLAGNSSGNNAVSLATTASNIYKAISGGFEGLATTIADTVQSALYGSGLSSNIASNGAFATGVGKIGAGAAGISAGIFGGRTISGGFSAFGGSGNTAVNVGTAVGTLLGGPFGSALGGAIGGLVNRLFGRGPKETQSQGIRGTIGEMGASGESFQNWLQKGGLFRSDKRGTDAQALGSDITNTLTSGFTSLKSASEGFAKTLGVNATSLQGFTKSFDIAFGTDAQKNQEAVTKFFTDLGDEFATKLIPNISEFSRQGETASQTLERLSNVFEATNQVAAILGKNAEQVFGGLGLSSDKARERLVDLAGGIDSLANKAAAYASEFLSDAEKLAPVQKAVNEALASLGVSGVTTKAQFKAVVDSLDLTTEAGAKLFANLLDLAPAFAQVANAAELAAKQAKDAADALAESIQKAKDDALALAKDAVLSALEGVKRSVENEKSILKKAYDEEVAMIKAASETRKKAAQEQLNQAKEYLAAIDKVFNSLSSALENAVIQSSALDKTRRTNAQDYLQSIRGTDLTKAGGLDTALGALSGNSKNMFSTFEDYARDQARTAGIVSSLREQARTERTFAELTIERLDATIEAIELSTEQQLDAAEKRYEEEVARLDKQLELAQKQVDALFGIDNSVKSLAASLSNLGGAMAGYLGQQAANAGSGQINPDIGIAKIYQEILGRTPDKGGLDFYLNAYLNKGVSLTDIAKDIAKSPEAMSKGYMLPMGYKLPSFDVGTNNIPSDMLAMVHKGERIVPAADNAEIMRRLNADENTANSESVKQLLKELITTVQRGDVANVQKTAEMLRILKKFDQDGLPETRDVEG